MTTLLLVFLLVGVCVGSAPTGTGLEFVVHQTFLDEVNVIVPEIVNKVLPAVAIPPLTGSVKLPEPLGDATYEVTDIHMPALQFSKTSSKIGAQGITVAGSGGLVKATAAYHWKTHGVIKASDHGTVDITIEDVTLNIPINIGEANGRPTIATPGVALILGKIDLKFHGKVAKVYNALAEVILPTLKNAINKEAPPAINKAINEQLEAMLAKLQVVVPWKNVLMDLSLTGPPVYGAAFVSFGVKAMWMDRDTKVACPFSPAALPSAPQDDNALEVFGATYVADCASLVYYKQGLLNTTITQNTVPDTDKKALNTTTYKLIIPNMYKAFPDEFMAVEVVATAPPMLHSSPAKGLIVEIATEAFVGCSTTVNGTYHPAFSLFLSANMSVALRTNISATGEAMVFANATGMECGISLASSQVGDIPIDVVAPLIEAVCTKVPAILDATVLQKGFPIPSIANFTAINPTLTWGEEFVGLSLGIKYSP